MNFAKSSLKWKDISFGNANPDEIKEIEKLLNTSLLIIPSINGGKLLSNMIPTLRVPAERIIVLDQGSTDSTYEVCQRYGVEIQQLNTPHTYTQCCNIALGIARMRHADFVYIANNDIIFVTDVARELLYEMSNDISLGAVSCSQVIPLVNDEIGVLSHRVYWNLDRTEFEHDRNIPEGDVYRLESDFCEGTCVLIRTKAATEIGGFDDNFGFYHEDADFGIRLREAGYTTAYLPQSQIKHFAGSTFAQGKSEARLNYINNSRKLFTDKHLGYGLKYVDHGSDVATSWNIINQNLFPYMKRFGLIDNERPELLFSHPGIQPYDCLYSVWETSNIPQKWIENKNKYKSTYLPSMWNLNVFKKSGFERVHYVPLGVETDIFQPWGKTERQYDGPTFLWFARVQYRKGYDVMLKAWQTFSIKHPDAMLIVCGHGVLPLGSKNRSQARQWRKFLRFDDDKARISYRETITPLANEELASFYRSVDFLVLTSRSEGFGFSVVEAMACGVITIFTSYGSTTDMMYDGAITFGGREVEADYSDKEFSQVGNWWEPDPEDVSTAMARAMNLTLDEKKAHFRKALILVRTKFTWRNTCLAIRADLKKWQVKKSIDYKRDVPAPITLTSISDFLKQVDLLQSSRRDSSTKIPAEINLIEAFGGFDREFYLNKYPDIKESSIDPLNHYIFYGWREERNPSELFDTKSFFAADPIALKIMAGLNDLGFGYNRDYLFAKITEWQIRGLREIAEDDETTDEYFIDLLYKIALNRKADADGLDHYMKLLAQNPRKRKILIRQMFSSSERAKIFPFIPTFSLPSENVGSVDSYTRVRSQFNLSGSLRNLFAITRR
ncbi:glycosyltransferase [Methylobacterium sp. E-041]|uniref:glycosyltransferase n=1 Tax=Methylobacterium sp. E-041 TaxID=2836573 RepID=UPI001FBA2B31|nr:glycosyltransferase [Methylobacterium sp. E-041]MCJ2105674.1 glycosyltransferase [Methylobacterium sp. E-041]